MRLNRGMLKAQLPMLICIGVLLAFGSVDGSASEPELFEVVQPMDTGQKEIVLKTVTYSDYLMPLGAELELMPRRNFVKHQEGLFNTNLLVDFGVGVTTKSTSGSKKGADGYYYVDTAAVTIDFRESARRVTRGMTFGYGSPDSTYLESLVAATERAVMINAGKSWQAIHYVRLRTVRSSGTRIRTIKVVPAARSESN